MTHFEQVAIRQFLAELMSTRDELTSLQSQNWKTMLFGKKTVLSEVTHKLSLLSQMTTYLQPYQFYMTDDPSEMYFQSFFRQLIALVQTRHYAAVSYRLQKLQYSVTELLRFLQQVPV